MIWGLLHAFAMIIHRIYSFYTEGKEFLEYKSYKIFAWFLTFNFINIAWVFFRSENLEGAINLLKSMFGIAYKEFPFNWYRINTLLEAIGGKDRTIALVVLALIFCLGFKNSIDLTKNFKVDYKNLLLTMILFYVAVLTLVSTPYTEFIYFNF